MRVATWNVNGVRARFEDLKAFVASSAPDLLCLQEIKATATPEPLTGLPNYHSFWHGGPGGYSGVSLHVRRDLCPRAPAFRSPDFDFEHRIVQTDIGDVTVMSVYVPNGNKDLDAKMTFLRALVAHARELRDAGRRVLICGDLNVTRSNADLHPKHVDPRAIGQTTEERELMAELLAVGLIDVLRDHFGDDDTVFTWWPPWREEKAKNRGWRIDYVLASDELHAAIQSCTVLKEEGTSDHAPLIVDMDLQLSP